MPFYGYIGNILQPFEERLYVGVRCCRHRNVVLNPSQGIRNTLQAKLFQCSILALAGSIRGHLEVLPKKKAHLINRGFELPEQVEFQGFINHLLMCLVTAAKVFQALLYLAQIFRDATHSDDDFLHKLSLSGSGQNNIAGPV